MKDKFITGWYHSNCIIEAIKAKFHNPEVKIYFCKPRRYKCFWFKGAIRQFDFGFAKKYSDYRNKKRCS